MEKVWLKQYPKGIPSEINLEEYRNIIEVFDQAGQRFRNRPAFTNMGVTMSFHELDQLSGDFASFLQNELKLKKGDRIAIQMPNLLQFPIAFFGSLRAGLIVVNTNPLYTAREMKHQFVDSGAKAIVIMANFASQLEKVIKDTEIKHVIVTEIADRFPQPKRFIVNSVVKYVKKMVPSYNLEDAYSFNDALKLGRKQSYTPVEATLDEVALLQYTGGTTGVSKGAMLTHKNLVANMQQITEWIRPKLVEGEEVVITALPLYHIFSLTLNCMTFLKYGSHNILITNPKDIPAFIKELCKYPFTAMSGVNTLFNALMNHEDFTKIDFSQTKVSVAGGMALQRAVSERWKKLTQSVIIEGYGLTETSPVVCCNPIDGTDRVGTIGLPLPSTDVKLVNDEGQEVGPGEPGEICVFGPQVMKGYWQRPEETEAVMLPGHWFKTGDIAEVSEDGFFKIVDRKKDMILVSGFNVYPNEIEDVVAQHNGVNEVAAVGIPNEKSGEVVKIFVVKKDPSLTAEGLIQFCKENLTSYKVPKEVEFRDELPKTNVGKILRRALRDEKK